MRRQFPICLGFRVTRKLVWVFFFCATFPHEGSEKRVRKRKLQQRRIRSHPGEFLSTQHPELSSGADAPPPPKRQSTTHNRQAVPAQSSVSLDHWSLGFKNKSCGRQDRGRTQMLHEKTFVKTTQCATSFQTEKKQSAALFLWRSRTPDSLSKINEENHKIA